MGAEPYRTAEVDETDVTTDPGGDCERRHQPDSMELVNTMGGRCGEVYECPDCGHQVLQTPGLLVGGEKIRPLSPDE